MSVRVVYRNSLIYYALMPGLWLSSTLVYMGFGPVYVWYAIAKMTVIIAAHSGVLWDQALLKNRATASTMGHPSSHLNADHSPCPSWPEQEDENTHYKGNYGNFLFLWDVLFGTAHLNDELLWNTVLKTCDIPFGLRVTLAVRTRPPTIRRADEKNG